MFAFTGVSFAPEAEVQRGDGETGYLKSLFYPFHILQLIDGEEEQYPYHKEITTLLCKAMILGKEYCSGVQTGHILMVCIVMRSEKALVLEVIWIHPMGKGRSNERHSPVNSLCKVNVAMV